ncbi:MBL fold metallo-hydrolase [Deltaproteobacteria bacterium]|nr:MBL fold metallo-hydrolase [Deltaproteobacteria bacterium]
MNSSILSGNGMTVIQAQLGEWDNLNHLLVCEKTGEACIVDPFSGEHWLAACKKNDWNLKSALLTHSHWDHTRGVQTLFDTGVEIWLHQDEEKRGWAGPDNGRFTHSALSTTTFKVGELIFEIHCTPGHSPGHITIIGNGVIISGDCLFLGRCGRTDLFGGDLEEMHQSLVYLKAVLQGLPSDWLVLPGHQYSVSDGSIPTFLSVSELLNKNEALIAAGNKEEFYALEFLAFDDSLAEKARRKKARN